jgi:hypothetical protein
MKNSSRRSIKIFVRLLPAFVFLWLNGLCLLACTDTFSLFAIINRGDQEAVKEFFRENDINGYYGEKKLTPLTYAIQQEQYSIIKLLIRIGADLNQSCQDKTPLIHSVQTSQIKLTKYLIRKGADINGLSEGGNSALIYAAYEGTAEMAILLVRKKIDFNIKNSSGFTALDYANEFNNVEVARYLRSISARSIATTYPDYLDGPHVFWMDDQSATVVYMKRDSATDKAMLRSNELNITKSPYKFAGFAGDTSEYIVYKEKIKSPFMFTDINRIFVLGDIHGGYESLVGLLQNHNIIDKELNWTWGDGHLVFLGDIFDRGEKVTECFWLIYKLEKQAHVHGGAVHLIIGNHELLILTGELSYVSAKYTYMTRYIELSYSSFYTDMAEFGKWLRTKNAVIKIDDKLFIHGGISPDVLATGMSIFSINNCLWDYFSGNIDSTNRERIKILLDPVKGIFWYRGYFFEEEDYPVITEEEIDQTLKLYNVSKIIVGHTNVSEIKPLYNNKIYATDIPYYNTGYEIQGLLIRKNEYYRAFRNGTLERIE